MNANRPPIHSADSTPVRQNRDRRINSSAAAMVAGGTIQPAGKLRSLMKPYSAEIAMMVRTKNTIWTMSDMYRHCGTGFSPSGRAEARPTLRSSSGVGQAFFLKSDMGRK